MEKNKTVQDEVLFIGICDNLKDFRLQSGLGESKQSQNVFKIGEMTSSKACSFREK